MANEKTGESRDYYPPPPPGPPPQQQYQQYQQPQQQYQQPPQQQQYQQPPQPYHSNEVPIPDFAPPPGAANDYYQPEGDHKPSSHGSHSHSGHGHSHSHSSDHGHGSKPSGLSKLSALGARAASPINMLANKMGSEGFLPSTMDKECEKAARIIRGFCKDGILSDQPDRKRGSRAIITIPAKVLQRAVGLAIFTTGRVGFHLSGATGSGVLIARMADGSWSPPSGIQIHSVGAGFMIGADIYDCVLVLNSQEALNAFKATRISLGSDLAVVAGPYGAGGSVNVAAPIDKNKDRESRRENLAPGDEKSKDGKNSPLRQAVSSAAYSYIKSRGVYAGVQVDGTVVTSRQTANADFYGAQVSVERILHGQVPPGGWTRYGKVLLDAIRAAEGQKVQNPSQPPSDAHYYGPQYDPLQQHPPHGRPEDDAWANTAPATIFNPAPPQHTGTNLSADPAAYYRSASPGSGSGSNPTSANPAHPVSPMQPPSPQRVSATGATGVSGVSATTTTSKEEEARQESARHSAYEPPPPQYTVEEASELPGNSGGTLPPAYNEFGSAQGGGYGTPSGKQ